MSARQSAKRHRPITSQELDEVFAVSAVATPLAEEPITLEGESHPSLFQRRFALSKLTLIRGSEDNFAPDYDLECIGFTLNAPSQRVLDRHSPILDLEGQSFFDQAMPSENVNVLLLIGEPDLPSIRGFMGNSASIVKGQFEGQPVRAFMLEGLNQSLSESIPFLVGWQGGLSKASAEKAVNVPHPLVAMDALRIAVSESDLAIAEVLASALLHPSQHPSVKHSAIPLISKIIANASSDTDGLQQLILAVIKSWEAERSYRIDSDYLEMFNSVFDNISNSDHIRHLRAVAENYHSQEHSELSDSLLDKFE